MLWALQFSLAFAEAFAALQELNALRAYYRAVRRRTILTRALWVAWWTIVLCTITTVGGMLMYRADPWLGIPEVLGAGAGCLASLLWRKRKRLGWLGWHEWTQRRLHRAGRETVAPRPGPHPPERRGPGV